MKCTAIIIVNDNEKMCNPVVSIRLLKDHFKENGFTLIVGNYERQRMQEI